ncbi:acyl dehydratase [Halovivax gelatinilyticus]|uniref:acyl dehydratase n=1 Tax=Halovivax gelatinilyticus TaxID=2961597 RepID=UPI0020CA3EF8|nr:acyl dehydratase [Halovivax gelatinilyticus]
MIEWTDPSVFEAAIREVETLEKGNFAEAFSEGDRIEHEPGLRLSRWGNEAWMSQTLNHDPAYWRTAGSTMHDADAPPIHPDYLLATTLGATVEDLSEKGGYFLGRTDVRFPGHPVELGTELTVASEVRSVERSRSRPEYAIVTWRTNGRDAATDELLCSYERTNMIPRRPDAADVATEEASDELDADSSGDERQEPDAGDGSADLESASKSPSLGPFVTPAGPYFEDFVAAVGEAASTDGTVAYQHERGRTLDDVTVTSLPLATLNTAKQHHNADAMAETPSGGVVAYGDVTRSIALAHARSDEVTLREVGYEDESFHTFVRPGDTIYTFTRVLDVGPTLGADVLDSTVDGPPLDAVIESASVDADEREPDARRERRGDDAAVAGVVRFQHIAYNQRDRPVYSGSRTALIATRRDERTRTIHQ